MSRTYIVYIEWNNLSEDEIASFLCEWCGFSQIFKIRMNDYDRGFAYAEMGCSGGIAPEDTLYELRNQLEKIGAEEIGVRAWSLHPDEALLFLW